MTTRIKFFSILVLLIMILIPTGSVAAKGLSDGKVIFGTSFTLKSGETLDGDLFTMGGDAFIEEQALVNGAVVLMGGNLTVNGEVNGDVVVIGGIVTLESKASVHGSLVIIGATIQKDEEAFVEGETYAAFSSGNIYMPPILPDFNWPDLPDWPGFPLRGNLMWNLVSVVVWAVLLGLLAMLVTVFLANPTQRVAQAISSQPFIAGGLGLLTAILLPVALVIMVITIILIPVALLAILLVIVAGFYGWIALGTEIGLRITRMSKGNWQLPFAAGLGTFILTIVASGISAFVPCIGWLVPALIVMVGLGAVVMSRFGSTTVSAPAAASLPAPAPEAKPPALPEQTPDDQKKARKPRTVAKK